MHKIPALLLLILILIASSLTTITPASSSENEIENSMENTWSEKAPMHQARAGLGVAVVNGKIYAIGGLKLNYQDKTTIQSIDLTTNEEYNPATNTWSSKAPIPTARDSFAIAVYENKIYCIGGVTGISRNHGQILTTANEVYDPATDTWENRTELPTPRIQPSASVLDGKIYVLGGYPNNTLIEVYDPATDNWSTKPSAPEVMGLSVANDGKVYCFSAVTQIYNVSTETWSLGVPRPYLENSGSFSLGCTTGSVAPSRIYLFSGMTEVYDPQSNSWGEGAVIHISRGVYAVAVVDDLIYAIGGLKMTYPASIPTDAPAGSGSVVTYYSTVEQYTPFGYGTVPPVIEIVSPMNQTSSKVSLNFTVNRPVGWAAYSLDGKENVTITGNTTITGLSDGLHSIAVYANDSFGNMGVSEAAAFKNSSSFSNCTCRYYFSGNSTGNLRLCNFLY